MMEKDTCLTPNSPRDTNKTTRGWGSKTFRQRKKGGCHSSQFVHRDFNGTMRPAGREGRKSWKTDPLTPSSTTIIQTDPLQTWYINGRPHLITLTPIRGKCSNPIDTHHSHPWVPTMNHTPPTLRQDYYLMVGFLLIHL